MILFELNYRLSLITVAYRLSLIWFLYIIIQLLTFYFNFFTYDRVRVDHNIDRILPNKHDEFFIHAGLWRV